MIGPGRLGRTLAVLLPRAGHSTTLLGRGDAVPDADLVLLAVPDRALAEVAAALPRDRVVAHLSGATGLDALGDRPRGGSLHPLMTFPGPEVAIPDLTGVAAAVDALDEPTAELLSELAESLGLRPVRVPGDRRLYHCAAVMAGNFATVLLHEASMVLGATGVPPEEARRMLAPLAHASLANAVADPRRALTGPVARGDEAVLAAHREALAEHGLETARSLHSLMAAAAGRLLAGGDP